MIKGVPLNENMDYTGNFFTLLHPFALVIGLMGLAAILLQGSTYASMKVSGTLQERARKLSKTIWPRYVALLLLGLTVTAIYTPGAFKKVLAWVFTGLVIGCLVIMRYAFKKEKDGLAFTMSSGAFLSLWGIAGSVHFPNLVKASNNPELSLTISNSSSSELTLKVMLIIAVVGMPLVIGYTIYLYKVFKGKVATGEEAY